MKKTLFVLSNGLRLGTLLLICGCSGEVDVLSSTAAIQASMDPSSQPSPDNLATAEPVSTPSTSTTSDSQPSTEPEFLVETASDASSFPITYTIRATNGANLEELTVSDFEVEGFSSFHAEIGPIVEGRRQLRVFGSEVNASIHVRSKKTSVKTTSTSAVRVAVSPQNAITPVVQWPSITTESDGVRTVSGFYVPYQITAEITLTNELPVEIRGLEFITENGVRINESETVCGSAIAAYTSCTIKIHYQHISAADQQLSFQVKLGGSELANYRLAMRNAIMPKVWIDPDNSSTIYSDANCTTAIAEDDSVGCVKSIGSVESFTFTQSTAANRPIYQSSDGFAGMNVLYFDGSNDFLSGSADIRNTSGGAAIFAVFHRSTNGPQSWQRLFSSCWWADSGNDINAPCFALAAPFGDPAGFSSTPIGTAVNAVQTDVRSLSGVYIKSLVIGKNNRWSSEHLLGEVGELLVYDEALPADNAEPTREYLQKKWKTRTSFHL